MTLLRTNERKMMQTTLLPHEPERPITRAHIKALKAKWREARAKGDSISRGWYGALLEGAKPSPWYYDNNAPSLYRSRCMVVAAMAGLAINHGHELAGNGFEMLRNMRRQLPNTFATLPALLKRWEAAWSARIDAGIAGVLEVEQPKDAAEVDDLNVWTASVIKDMKGQTNA
jgi:hypothetical protein